jgi:hypothetical protein
MVLSTHEELEPLPQGGEQKPRAAKRCDLLAAAVVVPPVQAAWIPTGHVVKAGEGGSPELPQQS